MTVKVIGYQPVTPTGGTLQGLADITYEDLVIRSISVHAKGTRRWCLMPAKPGPRNSVGRCTWAPFIEFQSQGAKADFDEQLLASLEEFESGSGKGGRRADDSNLPWWGE